MRSEAYDMLTEMQTLRTNSKDFIDKVMKSSIDGESLRHMTKEDFSMMQEGLKLLDEFFLCLDKSINYIEKAMVDQSEANGKIDDIYRMMKKDKE